MEAIREMPLSALLAGGVFLACTIFLALLVVLRRDPKDAPPKVSIGVPLLGNIKAFVDSPMKMIGDCYDK